MFWTIRLENELYVIWRGQIVYKRWIDRDVGAVMHSYSCRGEVRE